MFINVGLEISKQLRRVLHLINEYRWWMLSEKLFTGLINYLIGLWAALAPDLCAEP